MIKTKCKNNSKTTIKVKVPKIEINECKVKTRDPKKLENEMFRQAKEAKLILDKLLAENGELVGRARSASLNASVENLLLSRTKNLNKLNKPRGSVPNIGNFSKRFLNFGHKSNLVEKSSSQPVSPTMSPDSSRRNQILINPLRFLRKYSECSPREHSNNSINIENSDEEANTVTLIKSSDLDNNIEKSTLPDDNSNAVRAENLI